MKTFALLSAAALIGAGSLASSGAEARGGALAAGIIGGLAAGALIGAASQAHAGPAYGYDAPAYGYDAPAHGYGGPPRVVYRPAPAYRGYEDDAPAYAPRRILVEHREPYGYGPDRGWHYDRRDRRDFGRDRDCDRDDRGW